MAESVERDNTIATQTNEGMEMQTSDTQENPDVKL